jgi:thioredoxin reductase
MALERVRNAVLFARLVAYGARIYFSILRRALSAKVAALTARAPNPPADPSDIKNVVVVGAAFAGYFAARILAASLPRDGRYRLVVIEPNSHFNFTWVLPRFCVVEGHEHKAFIPYQPSFFSQCPKGMVRWVRDRVTSVKKESVVLRSGEEIPYEFLIIATGSTVADGLPSRVGVEDRAEGIELLKGMQGRVKAAARIVVAGGGAAGVELATDAKNQYPDKSVTLVHSRQAVMHRFGPGLQNSAMDALQRLGVDVILGERVDAESADGKFITLSSGRKIECDCFVWYPLSQSPPSFSLPPLTCKDQLHGAETGVSSSSRSRSQRHRPLWPHPSEADASDRRRVPSQRLCMR